MKRETMAPSEPSENLLPVWWKTTRRKEKATIYTLERSKNERRNTSTTIVFYYTDRTDRTEHKQHLYNK